MGKSLAALGLSGVAFDLSWRALPQDLTRDPVTAADSSCVGALDTLPRLLLCVRDRMERLGNHRLAKTDFAAHRCCFPARDALSRSQVAASARFARAKTGNLHKESQRMARLFQNFSRNFPISAKLSVQNHIMTGLAPGSLIPEVRESSGSWITARQARSFAPNSPIDPRAELVQSRREVVDGLPPELGILSDEKGGILELLKMDEATRFDKIFRSSGAGVFRRNRRTRQLPGNMQARRMERAIYHFFLEFPPGLV